MERKVQKTVKPKPKITKARKSRATKAIEVAKPTPAETLGEALNRQRAGFVPDPEAEWAIPERGNRLFDLPEEQRSKLFAWLRDCPYDDAVLHLLKDQGIEGVTKAQLSEFFQLEAEHHWQKRIERAAVEANALVQLAERSPVKFSSGILAALGQEAFRQIASGQVEPQSMGRIAHLFLKARGDERTEQMQELKREEMQRKLQGQIEHALEQLADEVDKHPLAREAFEALRRELAASANHQEDTE